MTKLHKCWIVFKQCICYILKEQFLKIPTQKKLNIYIFGIWINARKYKLNFCSKIVLPMRFNIFFQIFCTILMNKTVPYFPHMEYLSYEMTSNTLVDRIFVGLVGCMSMDSINLLFIASGMTSKSWWTLIQGSPFKIIIRLNFVLDLHASV